jgi:hypothetical protein
MGFSHLILTLFNVRVQFQRTNGPLAAPSVEWMRHRFQLFDQFCYPSVQAQTNSQFKWMVFFDSATPAEFRAQIARYAQWENFIPCYIEDTLSMETFAERKEALLGEHIGQAEHVITSWLDNDDALCKDYVAEVQRLFTGQSFEFLNFTNGYTFNIQRNKLYKRKYRANPFISLIEQRANFKTVWCASHMKLASLGEFTQVETKPMWLQVIHGKNVLNRTGYRMRAPIGVLDGEFTLNYALKAANELPGLLQLEHGATRMMQFARKLMRRMS